MTLVVDINQEDEAWSALADFAHRIDSAVAAAAATAGAQLAEAAEVSVLLCDDARIRELNRMWRGIDKPTNVLSFPAAVPDDLPSAPLLGDIAISFQTTAREADRDGKEVAGHAVHLVVHGFLHLLGFDHIDPAQAAAMEDLERAILQRLGIDDPYAETVLIESAGA